MSKKIINPKLHFYLMLGIALSIFLFMTLEYARFFQPHSLNLIIALIIGFSIGVGCFLIGVVLVKSQSEGVFVVPLPNQKGLNPIWILTIIILTIFIAFIAIFLSVYLLFSAIFGSL